MTPTISSGAGTGENPRQMRGAGKDVLFRKYQEYTDWVLLPLIELKGDLTPNPPFSDFDSLGGLMSTKLHVGNISSVVLEDDLKATFSQFGRVETVQIARDPVTGTSRGFAIVAMSKDEDASAAIARLNFTQYAGRTIGVSRSPATWT